MILTFIIIANSQNFTNFTAMDIWLCVLLTLENIHLTLKLVFNTRTCLDIRGVGGTSSLRSELWSLTPNIHVAFRPMWIRQCVTQRCIKVIRCDVLHKLAFKSLLELEFHFYRLVLLCAINRLGYDNGRIWTLTCFYLTFTFLFCVISGEAWPSC